MNKSIIKLFLLGGLTITSITSCTDNYMDYNKNPYEVTDDEMERDAHKLGAALVGMQSVIVPVGEHLAQFSECLLGGVFSGYMADSKTWGNSFSYFNQSEDWNGKVYLDIMPEIYSNLAEVKKSTTDPIPLAVAEVLKVTAIVRLIGDGKFHGRVFLVAGIQFLSYVGEAITVLESCFIVAH